MLMLNYIFGELDLPMIVALEGGHMLVLESKLFCRSHNASWLVVLLACYSTSTKEREITCGFL
jgi:hypothetical protein